MERIRPQGEEQAGPCEEMRWALCGLAVGQSLGQQSRAVAGHVSGCPDCDQFVDELAGIRRSLGVDGGPPEPGLLAAGQIAERARSALARELEARLARDLLAVARGATVRPLRNLRRDAVRLAELRHVSKVSDAAWVAARRALLGPLPVSRGRLLHLASVLDGSGLDVALAWLSFLVRSGQDGRAQEVTERLLAEVS